jgi:hypothetical protein
MDRLMARVGLNGRAFIPLLSSFACAVPLAACSSEVAVRLGETSGMGQGAPICCTALLH